MQVVGEEKDESITTKEDQSKELDSLDDFVLLDSEDIEFFNKTLQLGLTGLYSAVNAKITEFQNKTLDIAFIGRAGVGKSTLMNTFRGLSPNDPLASVVDVIEATTHCTPFAHPKNKKIRLWDIPGVGTPNFTKETYEEKTNLKKYDFYLIITADRFFVDDSWLCEKIKSYGKHFYLVRTKFDQSFYNHQQDGGTKSEEELKEYIKKNCYEKATNVDPDDVFIISGWLRYTTKWDYPKLHHKIRHDLPKLQGDLIVMYMTGYAKDIIEEKEKLLYHRARLYAFGSGLANSQPIPGVDIGLDIALLLNFSKEVQAAFSSDPTVVNFVLNLLKVGPQKIAGIALQAGKYITQEGLISLLMELTKKYGNQKILQYFAKALPFVGSVVSGGIGASLTYVACVAIVKQQKMVALELLDATKNSWDESKKRK